jgi:hypothetical protein
METTDDKPLEPFETRLRRTLHAGVPSDDSFAGRVLARIGDLTPAEMLQERILRSVRRWSVAAAILLAVLVIFAASLERGSGGGAPEESWIDVETEIPGILHAEAYLEEYSNEAEVLAAVFTVEMAR